MKRIADRIGYECRRRGLTARQLAGRGGLSIVAALMLRDGSHTRISTHALAGCCKALDAQPKDLLAIVEESQFIVDNEPAPAGGEVKHGS